MNDCKNTLAVEASNRTIEVILRGKSQSNVIDSGELESKISTALNVGTEEVWVTRARGEFVERVLMERDIALHRHNRKLHWLTEVAMVLSGAASLGVVSACIAPTAAITSVVLAFVGGVISWVVVEKMNEVSI